MTFFWIALLLIIAKLAGLVEKFGQPAVLGELVAGVILGNLALVGFDFFESVKSDSIITFLAELGVVILLFQIGLESNIQQMKKVGWSALFVAIVGVITPFVLGTYVIGPWLLPGLEFITYLFIGAALTATSVGITARVFKDLGKLQIKEAQIILGAAVIDDVLGLVILTVVSAIATVGVISAGAVGVIVAKAALFLGLSVLLGQVLAEQLGKWFSKINTGTGMKFTLAIAFGLFFAYVAKEVVGLEPIIGAFAAGLVLDPVHFRFFNKPAYCNDLESKLPNLPEEHRKDVEMILEKGSHSHIEELIEPVSFLFVPLFFLVTGMDVSLAALGDPKIVGIALAITIIAIIGKLVAGLAATGNSGMSKLIIGFGMVPRGEVGLIFAAIGQALGVISAEVFSILVIMVILTTLVTPPVLAVLLKKQEQKMAVN
ncbi:MAG: cation:proton antiporter [Candidatus Harrisonbacteria bacterium CG10_big_fil_rev_8_21_14_0_10_38_8]|uniref:Cation:proton antiporter n=1 Tax=Candidatus Harrisonbacteria bacterium CG10_big_fil_rev_8_21_14_0_10_38_8 TaxID=1974582 RepID=A0A2M6WKW9_9BACT|nr:MAG: cation:proton antiporter [Candidatus Harrisonbacteria bacterium CG10_big_fil_rev_8_21_14_0_10_38_8]